MLFFVFSSRRRHTRCALVTGVQTCALPIYTDFDLKLIGWLNRVRAQVRRGAEPPHEFLELGHLLDEMRLFKSRDELKLMRKAAKVTVLAHQAAMRAARPGVHEYELQAQIECVFRAHDGYPAYGTIVGAGANGCVLHYIAHAAKANRSEEQTSELQSQ